MYKTLKVAILVIILIIALVACKGWQKPVESENFLMGTIISQRVYGKNAQKAIDAVNRRILELEELMTVNRSAGDASKINEMSGKSLVPIDQSTLQVLKKAVYFSRLTGGAFDVTVGKIVQLWGISTDNPNVPDKQEILDSLKLVNYEDIIIDEYSCSAGLRYENQSIDLGGIAKGYAGDEAIRLYKEYGITSAYINLGGNVVVLGKKPDGSPWRIGIQNPRSSNGKYIGIVEVADKTVVTSGDYERFFEKDGVRYHHIIDPKTGYPSNSDLISSTIIADLSVDADALSTSTFIMGLEKSIDFVENLEGVEGIFITKDKKVYATSGLRDSFRFSDESGEFEYVEKR